MRKIMMLILAGCAMGIHSMQAADVVTLTNTVSVTNMVAWRMPTIFSENMVLQRDVPVPIWGWGPEGQSLTVQLDTQKFVTVVTNGRWQVTLPPMPAGGPHSLILLPKDDTQIQLYSQVMFGEVWLICGQSNMQFPMEETAERDDALAHRHEYPLIRVAQVCHRNPHMNRGRRVEPVSFWGNVKWEQASYLVTRSCKTDIPGSSSAVSYFFARALQRQLGTNVPIGMIEVGAIMSAESWVSDEEVVATPGMAKLRGKGYPNSTSRCFDADIFPLVPYAVRGFAYYQGEMNAGRGEEYQVVLPALIRSWRKAWGNDALPFLIVQLPGFHKNQKQDRHALDMPEEILNQLQKDSAEHGYCGVREAQLMTRLNVPHTGLAVTIDVGDAYDIHPPRKLAVGERLALLARKMVYGEKELVAEGPLATGATFEGGAARIKFDDVGGGLTEPSGKLTGFELADADGVWGEAEAKIDGSVVVVTRAGVAKPTAVRYCWAGFPRFSLFNKEGLPASPFRF